MRLGLLAFFLFSWPAGAESIPQLTGPLVDRARLLSSSEASQVRERIEALNQTRKVQLAVLITDSLQGLDIESYTLRVAEAWKLGKKGADEGLLLVIAPAERRMRFEVGYGLEGELPDVKAKRILDGVLTPHFQKGRFAEGITLALAHVAHELRLSNEPPPDALSGRSGLQTWVLIILVFAFILMIVLQGALGPSHRRYRRSDDWFGGGGGWGGGLGGGGGFGGFGGGGGGFGGGGASGRW